MNINFQPFLMNNTRLHFLLQRVQPQQIAEAFFYVSTCFLCFVVYFLQ